MAFRYTWTNEDMEAQVAVTLKRHETPESLLCQMWNCDIESLESSTCGGFDGDGNEYELSFDEMVGNIKEMGCYGFVDSKQVIHFWVDLDIVSPSDFIGMMAHEKGHLTRPFHRDDMKEEIKAEKYGDAASFAFQIYTNILSLKEWKGDDGAKSKKDLY
jgi:hypothetical protein